MIVISFWEMKKLKSKVNKLMRSRIESFSVMPGVCPESLHYARKHKAMCLVYFFESNTWGGRKRITVPLFWDQGVHGRDAHWQRGRNLTCSIYHRVFIS